MKPSRLILYTLILIGVSSYIFFVEHGYKQDRQSAESQAAKFVEIEKARITQIAVYGTSGVNIELQRPSSDWIILSPIKTKADEFAVNSLLNTISEASPEKVISEKDVNWNEYGFGGHTLKVSIETDQGKNYELMFGAQNPAKSSYYMRLADDPKLYLVADTLKNALDKNFFDLRDKTLMSFAPSDVDKVIIERSGVKNEFVREGAAQWKMVSPEQFRVKNVVISTFLRKLSHLNALQIIDEPERDNETYGLKAQTDRISLFGKDLNQTLFIGAEIKPEEVVNVKKGHYVGIDGSNAVFIIDAPSITNFNLDADILQDKSLISLNVNEIEKIEVTLENRKWVLSKAPDKKWKMEEPERLESIKEWQITGILWKLRDLNYVSLISPIPGSLKELGLSDPKLIITLNDGDIPTTKSLKFGWIDKTSEDVPTDSAESRSEAYKDGTDDKPERNTNDINVPSIISALVEPSHYPDTIFQVGGDFVGGLREDLLTLLNQKRSD